MLYFRTIKDKYKEIYNEFISHLCIYAKAVRILAKEYLQISLIMPLKLQEIIDSVKETLIKTNPDYDIVIKRIHLYYDMKLVTFGIDRKRNLIIQFPIFVQPYTQQCFDLTCSYCIQDALHPSPVHLDWSSEDWDGDKAKAKEQKSLIDFDVPKQKMDTEQTMDIDEMPFHKLNLVQDKQEEKEPLEVTQSIVPLPSDPMNVQANTRDEVKEEGHMDMEIRLQKEEEKFTMYNRIYISQLSKEETSDTEMDDSAYFFKTKLQTIVIKNFRVF